MQVIGVSAAGNPQVEINQVAMATLREAGKILLAIGGMDRSGGTLVPDAILPVKPAKVMRARKKGDTKRDKTCSVCGKKFRDNTRTNLKTTCGKASCETERKRKYQREWARKRALKPAPVDIKASRLEVIRAAAARIREADPIETVAALNAQIQSEEN
jgi:hypothetical protein